MKRVARVKKNTKMNNDLTPNDLIHKKRRKMKKKQTRSTNLKSDLLTYTNVDLHQQLIVYALNFKRHISLCGCHAACAMVS